MALHKWAEHADILKQKNWNFKSDLKINVKTFQRFWCLGPLTVVFSVVTITFDVIDTQKDSSKFSFGFAQCNSLNVLMKF